MTMEMTREETFRTLDNMVLILVGLGYTKMHAIAIIAYILGLDTDDAVNLKMN